MIRYYIERPQESAFVEQYTRSPYFSLEIEEEAGQYYQPLIECFVRAQQEMIIKDFPAAVITTLTFDLATSLAQKQAAGYVCLTDELIEQVVEASW